MALLDKLKSMLGIGGETADRETETEVTIEHEGEPTIEEGESASGSDVDGAAVDWVDEASDETADHEDDEMDGEADDTADGVADETDEEGDAAGDEVDDADDDVDDAEPVAAGTDATASTGSLVDTDAETAEPAEAAGTVESDDDADIGEHDEQSNVDEAETPDDDTETPDDADVDDAEAAASDIESEPVDSIKGIGPAYADRLADAGIESIAGLAAADPEALGAEIDVSPKIVGRWVDRAAER